MITWQSPMQMFTYYLSGVAELFASMFQQMPSALIALLFMFPIISAVFGIVSYFNNLFGK